MAKKKQCRAIYRGSTAANGGRCLLESGHSGEHKTHCILVSIMTEAQKAEALKAGFSWPKK